MESYYAPYVFLIVVLLAVFILREFTTIKNELFDKVSLFILLLFIGLRGFVYSDWYQYYIYFKDTTTLWDTSFFEIIGRGFKTGFVEYGFRIYTIIVKSLFPNFFFWQFTICLIDIILLYNFLRRYSKNVTLSLIVFIFFGGLVLGFNLLRNFISILLFLNSLKYINEKKPLPFVMLNLIGLTFHFTSIIYFPLYFILNKRISKNFMWISFIIGNLIYLLQIKYIGPIVIEISHLINGKFEYVTSQYINSSNYGSSYGITIGYIERLFSFILVVSNYDSIIKSNKTSSRIFINSFYFYFMIFALFSEANIFTDRFTILFVFAYWILIPELYQNLVIRTNKIIWIFILVSFGTIKTSVANNNILNSYRNIIFYEESYKSRAKILERNKKMLIKK